MNTLINAHIRHLKSLTDGDPWVDESFVKKLSGIHEDNAFKRPHPELHSVAELISHMTHWKASVLSILKGGTRTVYMDSPENWLTNDLLQQQGWEKLRKRFFEMQDELISFIESNDDDYLDRQDASGEGSYDYFLAGIVDHDLYHIGQIGITIKFLHLS